MDNVEDTQRVPNAYELPCPICGGTRYTWGEMKGTDFVTRVMQKLSFAPARASTEARRCNTCGNIQMFDRGHGG